MVFLAKTAATAGVGSFGNISIHADMCQHLTAPRAQFQRSTDALKLFDDITVASANVPGFYLVTPAQNQLWWADI